MQREASKHEVLTPESDTGLAGQLVVILYRCSSGAVFALHASNLHDLYILEYEQQPVLRLLMMVSLFL